MNLFNPSSCLPSPILTMAYLFYALLRPEKF